MLFSPFVGTVERRSKYCIGFQYETNIFGLSKNYAVMSSPFCTPAVGGRGGGG